MRLTDDQKRLLKPYEKTLQDVTFNAKRARFVDSGTLQQLSEIYGKIAGRNVSCRSCGGKDWIKRLSFWYFGNKDGKR